jgi:predicted XRE-type DNA-binding protein
MARPLPTEEDLKERQKLSQEIKDFMKNNKFTEKRLGDICGISRRSVQMIKAGAVTPHPGTLHKIETLFSRYKHEGK